jgi:hypothetical protein
MKKLLLMLFSVGLVFSASAQIHGGVRGGGRIISPRVVSPRIAIIGGYVPFRPYLGYGYGMGYNPYFGYNPFLGPQMYQPARPSNLDLQVEDIKNDYQDRISSARKDKALPRKERKAIIRDLKRDRDAAVMNAKRNYYKTEIKS